MWLWGEVCDGGGSKAAALPRMAALRTPARVDSAKSRSKQRLGARASVGRALADCCIHIVNSFFLSK